MPISDDATWDDEWCWEHKTLEVVVGTDDKSGLVFVQKGFWMHVKSTHAVRAFTSQPHKKGTALQLQVTHIIISFLRLLSVDPAKMTFGNNGVDIWFNLIANCLEHLPVTRILKDLYSKLEFHTTILLLHFKMEFIVLHHFLH